MITDFKNNFCAWLGTKLINFACKEWMPLSAKAAFFKIGCWLHSCDVSKDGMYESW
tara:strand:- start:93 stop:260 length:168 start_codon:yes stop_codon:yes gene_type:complete